MVFVGPKFVTCECGHSEWVHYKSKCQLCGCEELRDRSGEKRDGVKWWKEGETDAKTGSEK